MFDYLDQGILLAVAWVLYFAIHSGLASLRVKSWVAERWPQAMAWYRLVYNALAVALLSIPLGLLWRNPGPILWQWSGWGRWLADGLALAAILGFFASLRYYDGAEFLGLRQLRAHSQRVEDLERFHLSPFHRYVRHPWYAFGLVILWTRDMSAGWLVTCVLISAYFWLGSRLEERKLIVYHGEVYRRYRQHVPALVPRPWRRLSRAECAALLSADRDSTGPCALAGGPPSARSGSSSSASTVARTSGSSHGNPP